jgi:hypothetical protein
MRAQVMRLAGFATLALALAGTAQAQGKGNGKAKHADKDKHEAVRRANGDVVVVPGNGRKVPPGLAKKPGQMPPGQYKKIYGTGDGASVLSDIFRRRGYTVTRLVPSGDSRYVYYRSPDGIIRRAIVSPGSERLSFTNVPAAILQEVLSRLY